VNFTQRVVRVPFMRVSACAYRWWFLRRLMSSWSVCAAALMEFIVDGPVKP
jgi:hypothetical protein